MGLFILQYPNQKENFQIYEIQDVGSKMVNA